MKLKGKFTFWIPVGVIKQENQTLRFCKKTKTFAMRSKEESSDYRYLPDPNLRPVLLKEEWIKRAKKVICRKSFFGEK